MKVYRYLSESELNHILAGEIDDIGNQFTNHKKDEINTHKYIEGVKYLHFFKRKEDTEKMQLLYRKHIRPFYFCEFEIPKKTLLFHAGVGYYSASGYDLDYVAAREYAIPTSKFKKEYLVKYEMDKGIEPKPLIKLDDDRQM